MTAAAPGGLASQAALVQAGDAVGIARAESTLSMTPGQQQQQCVAAYTAIAVPSAAASTTARIQLSKALTIGCTAMAVYSPGDVCAADDIAAAGQGSSNIIMGPEPTALLLRKGRMLYIKWAGLRQSLPHQYLAAHPFRVQSQTSAKVRAYYKAIFVGAC